MSTVLAGAAQGEETGHLQVSTVLAGAAQGELTEAPELSTALAGAALGEETGRLQVSTVLALERHRQAPIGKPPPSADREATPTNPNRAPATRQAVRTKLCHRTHMATTCPTSPHHRSLNGNGLHGMTC